MGKPLGIWFIANSSQGVGVFNLRSNTSAILRLELSLTSVEILFSSYCLFYKTHEFEELGKEIGAMRGKKRKAEFWTFTHAREERFSLHCFVFLFQNWVCGISPTLLLKIWESRKFRFFPDTKLLQMSSRIWIWFWVKHSF